MCIKGEDTQGLIIYCNAQRPYIFRVIITIIINYAAMQ